MALATMSRYKESFKIEAFFMPRVITVQQIEDPLRHYVELLVKGMDAHYGTTEAQNRVSGGMAVARLGDHDGCPKLTDAASYLAGELNYRRVYDVELHTHLCGDCSTVFSHAIDYAVAEEMRQMRDALPALGFAVLLQGMDVNDADVTRQFPFLTRIRRDELAAMCLNNLV